MAIPNIGKILEAQAAQRGENTQGSSSGEESEGEAMEILKLIFEYMKRTNKDIQNQLNEIREKQEELDKKIQTLMSSEDE